MLFENRAGGAGCAQLCGCITLTTELCLFVLCLFLLWLVSVLCVCLVAFFLLAS